MLTLAITHDFGPRLHRLLFGTGADTTDPAPHSNLTFADHRHARHFDTDFLLDAELLIWLAARSRSNDPVSSRTLATEHYRMYIYVCRTN